MKGVENQGIMSARVLGIQLSLPWKGVHNDFGDYEVKMRVSVELR